MINVNDNLERMKIKAEYFFRNSLPVHIKKYSGEWDNGWLEKISKEFLVLNEYRKGKVEILFIDIKDIMGYDIDFKKNKGEEETI